MEQENKRIIFLLLIGFITFVLIASNNPCFYWQEFYFQGFIPWEFTHTSGWTIDYFWPSFSQGNQPANYFYFAFLILGTPLLLYIVIRISIKILRKKFKYQNNLNYLLIPPILLVMSYFFALFDVSEIIFFRYYKTSKFLMHICQISLLFSITYAYHKSLPNIRLKIITIRIFEGAVILYFFNHIFDALRGIIEKNTAGGYSFLILILMFIPIMFSLFIAELSKSKNKYIYFISWGSCILFIFQYLWLPNFIIKYTVSIILKIFFPECLQLS